MNARDNANAVYDACNSVPAGMVITYGDLAELVGQSPKAARSVARVLGHRPNAGTSLDPLPWWRVVRLDGSLLDADQVVGESEKWVKFALGKLADEGVPLTDDGRVAMGLAHRMPIPDGITRTPRAGSNQQTAPAEPCWKHDKVQYSCRDCVPPTR